MYSIGDKIVHPKHGAGVIDSIVTQNLSGKSREYYILKLPTNNMTIMLPVESCDSIGVREIIDSERADEVITLLSTLETDTTQNWNKRFRENAQRIMSGDLDEIARVIKALILRDHKSGLSTSERKMLHSAKQILISELVFAKESTYQEIEAEIERAISGVLI